VDGKEAEVSSVFGKPSGLGLFRNLSDNKPNSLFGKPEELKASTLLGKIDEKTNESTQGGSSGKTEEQKVDTLGILGMAAGKAPNLMKSHSIAPPTLLSGQFFAQKPAEAKQPETKAEEAKQSPMKAPEETMLVPPKLETPKKT